MSKNEEWCGVCGNEIPNFGISKCTCNKRDPVNCNHSTEVPSYICSCDDECPCWKGCCKGNTPALRENERHLLEPYLKKMTNSHNDEELGRVFYNVAKRIGVPHVRQDDLGGYAAFEDLSLRDIKLMAQFVRELRK